MNIAIKLRRPDKTWAKYIEKLKEKADVKIIFDDRLEESYPDIDILITTNLNESALSGFPNLKAIFLFKTGTDSLPLEVIRDRGIFLKSSHANAKLIAEHAIALSFSLLHRVTEFHCDLKEGIWYSDGQDYMWKSISNMKIGILGLGHIGKSIHQMLVGFGCEIWGYNRSGRYPFDVIAAKSLCDLADNCDLIYICLPKTDQTCSLIDSTILQNMKGKYLVNVGRAEVCDEGALYNALVSGTLAGYAGDVWCLSPDKTDRQKRILPSVYPFYNLKNVVMSPHCATHEENAHERYIKDATESCIKFITEQHN